MIERKETERIFLVFRMRRPAVLAALLLAALGPVSAIPGQLTFFKACHWLAFSDYTPIS